MSRLPGLDYSLNPYFGCEHGCIYCYSRSIFLNKELALKWGTFVKARTNMPDVLSKELANKREGVVGISTVTDPYQPLEAKLQITRRCLEALSESHLTISIQTKSSLILRDLDLIKPTKFEVGITISTLDASLASAIEPKASPPDARAQVVEECSKRGVRTWVFLGPIIPEVNDTPEDITGIVKLAKKTGSYILYDKLNLRRWILEVLKPFFDGYKPGVHRKLKSLLHGGSDYWQGKAALIEDICAQNGVICESAFPSTRSTYPFSNNRP